MADGLTIRVETPFTYNSLVNETTAEGYEKKTKKNEAQENIAKQVGIQIAKKVGYGVSARIGSYTQNSLAQNQINMGINAISNVASFAANPVMWAVSKTIQTAFAIADDYVATRMANGQADYMKNLAGISNKANEKRGI